MMNKTNYKTIAVVAVNNVAIAMSATNGQHKHMKKFGQNNLIASLKVLKSVLKSPKPTAQTYSSVFSS